MQEQDNIAIFAEYLDEEASVLEIVRALSRQSEGEPLQQLRDWVAQYAIAQAHAGKLGFYIDEFGAPDIAACSVEEAAQLFAKGDIWSVENNAMLHVFNTD